MKVTRNFMFFSFLLMVFVAIIVVILAYKKPKNPYDGIKDFAACAKSGYPVMESYPRQCSLPNGKFFTETTVGAECNEATPCPEGYACKNNLCQLIN